MGSAPERKIKVVALTPKGAALARELCRRLPGARCWLPRAQAGGDLNDQPLRARRHRLSGGL